MLADQTVLISSLSNIQSTSKTKEKKSASVGCECNVKPDVSVWISTTKDTTMYFTKQEHAKRGNTSNRRVCIILNKALPVTFKS